MMHLPRRPRSLVLRSFCHVSLEILQPETPSRPQVNLEFLVRDRRTFVTGETHALKALFGENSSGSASYKLAVATVCSRLSGVFASLKVGPLAS